MEALRRVSRQDVAQAYPNELSGGMQMRVSTARALAVGPGMFFMDEAYTALDERSRERPNDDLIRLCEEGGLAVIFVTQSGSEVVFLSSRIVIMRPNPPR